MKLLSTMLCGMLATVILAAPASAAGGNPVLTGSTQKRVISHKGKGTMNPSYKTPTEWVFPHGNGKGEMQPMPYQRPIPNRAMPKQLPPGNGANLSLFKK